MNNNNKLITIIYSFLLLSLLLSPHLCLVISSLLLIPPFSTNVAKLCCQYPSSRPKASTSPSLTQSISWREKFSYPHCEKWIPKFELLSRISCLWPPCLTIMVFVVEPVYRAGQPCRRQVTRYTTKVDLQLRRCLILYVRPVNLLVNVVETFNIGQVSQRRPRP